MRKNLPSKTCDAKGPHYPTKMLTCIISWTCRTQIFQQLKILRPWILIFSVLSAVAWRSEKVIDMRMTCRCYTCSLIFLVLTAPLLSLDDWSFHPWPLRSDGWAKFPKVRDCSSGFRTPNGENWPKFLSQRYPCLCDCVSASMGLHRSWASKKWKFSRKTWFDSLFGRIHWKGHTFTELPSHILCLNFALQCLIMDIMRHGVIGECSKYIY